MPIIEHERLEQSIQGGCANYKPDRTKRPTGARAEDVPGFIIYPCSNCMQTEWGKKLNISCGIDYCKMHLAVNRYES